MSYKKANRQLYGIIIGQIRNDDLLRYLSQNHDDKGKEAMQYILSCHGVGTDGNKIAASDDEYKNLERTGIPAKAGIDEANGVLNKMTNIHGMLKSDDTYKISDSRHSRNLIHMVKNRGPAYKQELRMQEANFTEDVLRNIPQVASKLDGIMRVVSNAAADDEVPKEAQLRILMAECGFSEDQLLMFKARNNKASQKKCSHCDIAHGGTCYAKTISDGKTPDGWTSMEKAKKERIVERAEKIKPGCTKELSILSCQVQDEHTKVDCLAASVATYTFGADSLGYHWGRRIISSAIRRSCRRCCRWSIPSQ